MYFANEYPIKYNETKEISSFYFESYENLWLLELPFDFLSVLSLNFYQPWVMSLIGSVLVGLSGILPFIIIPIDDTATLKAGAGAKTLRLLLSFAVGGLLGDVFLHLLPEAWGSHSSHEIMKKNSERQIHCGLWVLAGLLVFVIVEKMFSFEKEDADEDKVDETKESLETNGGGSGGNGGGATAAAAISGVRTSGKTISIRRKKSSFILNDLTVNCATKNEPNVPQTLANGITNNNNLDSKIPPPLHKKTSNIHVSGYLNLMANSIDNFTHGLAVGGSFLLSTRVGILTTFAILVHEIPHEVGDFAILLRAGFSRWEAAWAQVYTASAGILGALTALMFSASSSAVEAKTSWILPFTAGGFLHIALVTVLPELLSENNPKESLKQLCSLASGITVMALLTFFIEG